MIRKIRNTRTFKGISLTLALSIFFQIVAPTMSWALTGGPAQPEFSSFTPIGTSDMVDLSSGDMSYNIPLMDVGGYPINLAYSSGVGMDDEASWVGLGWNLSVGQINRNVRGLPDDFNGDLMTYENYMKPNVTVGASFQLSDNLVGVPLPTNASAGISATYNNYSGFTMKPSIGMTFEISNSVSVGFNAQSGPDGLSISPSVSMHKSIQDANKRNTKLGASFGVSMNSRQGLTSTTLSMSKKSTYEYGKKDKEGKRTKEGKGSSSVGSAIGFTDQLYTPTKRVGMTTRTFTINAALGFEGFGVEPQGQITAYGTVMKVSDDELEKQLPAYGYSKTENAGSNGVLDFNREKDGSVSVNTTNLPITNYTYDIYSVQGQGVSGMYRPFRNQVGYVYDPYVSDQSTSLSLGAEFGTGNAFHAGLDIEGTLINSHSGNWSEDNNIIANLRPATSTVPDYEAVHFKNVGDLSADKDFPAMFTQTGKYEATRIAWNVNGDEFNRKLQSKLKYKINGNGNESPISVGSKIHRTQRLNRNQAIINVTWEDLNRGIGYGPKVNRGQGNQKPAYAQSHHVAEVQIIRNDGARYIYGQPAYNTVKKEATFSVKDDGDCSTGLVYYNPAHLSSSSSFTNLPNDKFLDRTTTPAYVHTHLLTSVLSTDYQDLSNDGPSVDDLGSYTKFSYEPISSNYKWRIPFQANSATYNEGLLSDSKDQRGNYVYGEKEQYLIKKIETKTHVAVFEYIERDDARGVAGENGGLDPSMKSYKLDRIKLYSIEEYNAGGTPIPIKTVHLEYNYELCPGVPNNVNNGGKLTLKKVYFTYRESSMGKYTSYDFTYGNNQPYNIKGYDSWGNYKPNNGTCNVSGGPTASEFPYVSQNKSLQDNYAQAWSLTKIELPSGGEINIEYESDDYAYVQDKEALQMFKVMGAGASSDGTNSMNGNVSETLFGGQLLNKPKTYLYVEVDPSENVNLPFAEIKEKYLKNVMDQPIYFRFFMNMTPVGDNNPIPGAAKYDYVTGYFEYQESNDNSVDNRYDGKSKIFEYASKKYLSIPVKLVQKEGGLISSTGLTNEVHPISKASWHFGRKYLSQHVYSNQPNGDTEDVEAMVTQLLTPSVFNNLIEILTGPNATLENKNVGRRFVKSKSWIRLKHPNGAKLGGGSRVKKVLMSDVWAEMTAGQGNYETMSYGQEYSYKLENGNSSGVATYEPVGNKENPFVQPVFSTTNHLLAPNEENYVEMPFGESFFPSPQVTYSRVKVANLQNGTAPAPGMTVKQLHRTGSVVTEFYTSRDYPTIVDQTIMEAKEDKNEALANILNLYSRKHFTATQGYTIHLNDMNGKQKAQWVYAEGQTSPISGVRYLYENHETPSNFSASSQPGRTKGKLNNEVVVIRPDGSVGRETIGVEVDFVNDFRENKTITEIPGINANLATFLVGIIPGIVPIPLPDYSYSEDQFRSASTTKVINTFGILKETIAYDAGASVSTRNLAWDESTGEVLLTETVDEYNDHYFTLNYPAHWYYKGMAQTSLNIGFKGAFSQVSAGLYTLTLPSGYTSSKFLIAGDEVILSNNQKAWINYVGGNQFTMIDSNGNAISGAAGQLIVIRSGHRNLQSAGVMNVTLMRNPLIEPVSGNLISSLGSEFLKASSGEWAKWSIINAGAVDYSDKWMPPCECDINTVDGGVYNPYRMNVRGVWRTKSSRTYLTGRNSQVELTPRKQGFFNKFSPMYALSTRGNWYKNFNDWTYVAEVTTFSPYGFELENKDALNRYSGAQYGYNNTFPMAVGANTKYSELGFDGFEDYGFLGCTTNAHFKFENLGTGTSVSTAEAHSGKHSVLVGAGARATMTKDTDCKTPAHP